MLYFTMSMPPLVVCLMRHACLPHFVTAYARAMPVFAGAFDRSVNVTCSRFSYVYRQQERMAPVV